MIGKTELPRKRTDENREVEPDKTLLVYIIVSAVETPMTTVQRFPCEHSRGSLRAESVEHSTKRHAAFVNVFMGIFMYGLVRIFVSTFEGDFKQSNLASCFGLLCISLCLPN